MTSGDILFESGDVQVIAVDSTPITVSLVGGGILGSIGGGIAFAIVAAGKTIATYHADLESVILDATHCAAYRAANA